MLAMLLVAIGVFYPVAAAALVCRLPPAQYDHEPTTAYRVIQDPHLFGNALTSADRSTIIIPLHVSSGWKACYLRHEKAHVNGWPADHPGLRYGEM